MLGQIPQWRVGHHRNPANMPVMITNEAEVSDHRRKRRPTGKAVHLHHKPGKITSRIHLAGQGLEVSLLQRTLRPNVKDRVSLVQVVLNHRG